jgi:cytoskeleton protein RodZ
MSESMNRKPNDDRQNEGRRLHLREVSSEFDDYDGIGADLKAGRVRLGQDIPDLANILRIRSEHLLAVEQGRFSDLPAPVYAVGFVRTYAEYVGLNGEDAIRRFKEEAQGLPHHTNLSFPTPEEESRVPKGWLLALAGIAAVLVYAGWYYAENKDRLNLAEVPAVPERLAAKVTTAPASQSPVRLQAPAVQATQTAPVAVVTPDETTSETADETSGETTSVVLTPTSEAAAVPVVEETSQQEIQQAAQATAEAEPQASLQPEPETSTQVEVVQPAQVAEANPSPQVVTSNVVTPETVAETVAPQAVATPTPAPVVEQPQPVAAVTETPVTTSLVEKNEVVAPVVSEPVATIDSVVAQEPENTDAVVKAPVQVQEPATASAVPSDEVTRPALPQMAAIEPEAVAPVTAPATETVAAPVITPTPTVEQAAIPVTGPQDGRKKEAFGSPAGESRVEVYARVDVWVQVTSRDGQPLLSRILRQGDSYYAPKDQAVFLTTGNAGALQILVDDVVIPAVGPAGAVRRDISLDPVSLLSNTPGNQSNSAN